MPAPTRAIQQPWLTGAHAQRCQQGRGSAVWDPRLVRGRPRHGRHAVDKLGAVQHVRIGEHALLQGDHDELREREVLLDHAPNVLRVAQVQRGVHLQARARQQSSLQR